MKQELYVTLPQGKLLGKEWISSFTGDTYYGFSGIPYAKTPVGELRFQVIYFSLDNIKAVDFEQNEC